MLYNSPTTTRQMQSHKLKDPAMMDFVDDMHRAKVKHVQVVRVLSAAVGGQENLPMGERDLQNRYR